MRAATSSGGGIWDEDEDGGADDGDDGDDDDDGEAGEAVRGLSKSDFVKFIVSFGVGFVPAEVELIFDGVDRVVDMHISMEEFVHLFHGVYGWQLNMLHDERARVVQLALEEERNALLGHPEAQNANQGTGVAHLLSTCLETIVQVKDAMRRAMGDTTIQTAGGYGAGGGGGMGNVDGQHGEDDGGRSVDSEEGRDSRRVASRPKVLVSDEESRRTLNAYVQILGEARAARDTALVRLRAALVRSEAQGGRGGGAAKVAKAVKSALRDSTNAAARSGSLSKLRKRTHYMLNAKLEEIAYAEQAAEQAAADGRTLDDDPTVRWGGERGGSLGTKAVGGEGGVYYRRMDDFIRTAENEMARLDAEMVALRRTLLVREASMNV